MSGYPSILLQPNVVKYTEAKKIYVQKIAFFWKPANPDMENGLQKKSKMSPEKNHIQRTLFERYQDNTAIEWITFLKRKKNVYSFAFKNVLLL